MTDAVSYDLSRYQREVDEAAEWESEVEQTKQSLVDDMEAGEGNLMAELEEAVCTDPEFSDAFSEFCAVRGAAPLARLVDKHIEAIAKANAEDVAKQTRQAREEAAAEDEAERREL